MQILRTRISIKYETLSGAYKMYNGYGLKKQK